MIAARARLDSLTRAAWFPLLAVLLAAVRFAAPSVTASLAVSGVDVAGLDVFFVVYGDFLPVAQALLAAVLLHAWPRGFGRDRWLLLLLVLLAWDLAFFPGELDSGYRILYGAWASLPLGLGVAATILAYGLSLDARLRRVAPGTTARDGFLALYEGFGVAYLLGSLRFVDYRVALGTPAPSGWLWFVNYAPVLLLGSHSIYFWSRLAVLPGFHLRGALGATALPVLGVLGGLGAAQGLGGFILSNVLAWGGSYEVFVPTSLSLSFVGFAVGAFLATAWALRGRMPAPAWRFVVAGVAATAFAGIQPFGGALASLGGILLGLTLAARVLLETRGAATAPPGGLSERTD